MTMAELCGEEQLVLAGDCLSYFSHWLTPPSVPRRFDTRFFVARMPQAQQTAAHSWETAGEHWVSPGEALAAVANGEWQMISPTMTTLESIDAHGDVASVFAAVAAGTHLPELTPSLNQQGMQTLR